MAKRPEMLRCSISFSGKAVGAFKEQASGMDGGDVVLAFKQGDLGSWCSLPLLEGGSAS